MSDFWADIREVLAQELFRIGNTSISVSTLITLAIILIATLWISKSLRRVIHRLLALRNPSAANSLEAFVHYVVLIVGFSAALSTAGIDLTGLFAAGAIFAVGLGFAMKSIVENFVAGFILLTERSIKPGDVLEVEGMVVQVVAMGIRVSIVRSRDGDESIIPNSLLSQTAVKNYTLRDSLFRVRVVVGVTYGSDMHVVKSTLEELAADFTARHGVASQQPIVLMKAFGSSSVDWEVGIWVNDPWQSRPFASELHQAIWWAFQEKGIVIAFPQLDLHLDTPVTESLRALGARAS